MMFLRVPNAIHERDMFQNTPLGIMEFRPTRSRNFWTFVTSGMSEIGQESNDGIQIRTEIIFYTKEHATWPIELLCKLASYPFEYHTNFSDGDTLSLQGPVSPTSALTGIFLSNALFESPEFDLMEIDGKSTQILWAFPITSAELGFISEHGSPRFKQLILGQPIEWLCDLECSSLPLK